MHTYNVVMSSLKFSSLPAKRGISSFPEHLGQVFPVYTQQWDSRWDAWKQRALAGGEREQLRGHLALGWPQHVTQLLQHLTWWNFVEKLTNYDRDEIDL